MTTFEDLDLGEAFGDFGDAAAAPRRRSRAWGAAAFLLAIALLVVGVVWLDAARRSPVDVSAAPSDLVPALAAEQTAADRIADADLDLIDVVTTTTRRLGTSAWGEHYVGLTAGGAVCLLTVVEGDVPGQSCARPTTHLALTTADVDGRDVVWLAAQGAGPTDAGWAQLAPNLWVRD